MAQPKTKRKGKPKRLVKPEKTTREAQKIIDINATQSPFFLLSPELRNRVYSLVLGGNDIHVSFNDLHKSLKHSICLAERSNTAIAEDNKSGTSTHAAVWWCRLHDACQWRGYRQDHPVLRLDLSLLFASKQIHQEAALLPFTLNKFVFTRLSYVGRFADKLLLAQKLAVAQIDVHTEPWWSHATKKDCSSIAKLRGLRTLAVVIAKHDLFKGVPGFDVVKSSLKAVKQIFGSLCPNDVKVSVLAFDENRIDGAVTEVPVPEEYRRLCRETEKVLCKSDAENATEQ